MLEKIKDVRVVLLKNSAGIVVTLSELSIENLKEIFVLYTES